MFEIQLDMLIAQLINFAIIFWIYKKFLATPIVAMIEERRALMKKLENADDTYQQMIDDASTKANTIIKDATDKKESIVSEAQDLAKQEEAKILEKANNQASSIVDKAEVAAKRLSQDFEDNFEEWVKATTEVVVKKLLWKESDLEKGYIEKLIQEAQQ